MSSVVVVGAQWGDEAKGKLVDILAQNAGMVVRYAGGSNAGHTVMVGDFLLKLHLIPSGILNPKTACVISDGVVVDPARICGELDGLREREIDSSNLKLSLSAHVVMPYHKALDRLEEERKGGGKIGTTMQGIGPTYEDKARRCGIRIADLVEPSRLADTAPLVQGAFKRGEKVVFEGAQGTMLDIDHGTYPFVTSSHPIAGGACLGTGVGPGAIGTVVGVCKAYTTRVGAGVFPTELLDETGSRIRERGKEYGTTTGRPRRIGWLDAVGLRFAAQVNGLDYLAVTLLDVLSTFPELRICTGYRYGGEVLTALPSDRRVLAEVEPVYETLAGWSEEISHIRRFEDLPKAAQAYVRRVEELVGVPAAVISLGRRREETILLEPGLFA